MCDLWGYFYVGLIAAGCLFLFIVAWRQTGRANRAWLEVDLLEQELERVQSCVPEMARSLRPDRE